MAIRERKRPAEEWPIRAYKFAVKPLGEFPNEVPALLWDIAREQRRLWNEFCAIRDKHSELINEKKEELQTQAQNEGRSLLTKTELNACLKEDYAKMENELKLAAKNSSLDWACYSELLARFAVARAKGKTKIKYGIKEVNIPHIWTGGGTTAGKLFTDKDYVRAIRPIDPTLYDNQRYQNCKRRYSTGNIKISLGDQEAYIDFKVHMERQIDPKSFIKRLSWCGKNTPLGWQWYIVITLEEPAKPKFICNSRIAALDLGWRKFDEYIRIGMLVDQYGRVVEFRLPLDVRDDKAKKKERVGKLRPGMYRIDRIKYLSDLWKFQSDIDESLEECKAALKPLLPSLKANLPEEHKLHGSIDSFHMVRNTGLKRIANYCRENNPPDSEKILAIIENWSMKSLSMQKTLYRIQERIVKRRKEIYYNIAHWIFRNYGELIWEGDLSIKNLIKDQEGPALDAAAKYRQYAAIGSFREILKQVWVKYNAHLHGVKAKGSSSTCSICEAPIKTGPKLELICENGHKMDQDVNAPIMLGQRVYKDIFSDPSMLISVGRKPKQEQIVVNKNYKDSIVHIEL